jgi:signal transduction histidine kinase
MEDIKFHNEISRELGGINQNLVGIKEEIAGLRQHVKFQNSRVRKLEDWSLETKTKIGIIALVVASAVSFIVTVIFAVFNKYL